jgi:hypothetical protein
MGRMVQILWRGKDDGARGGASSHARVLNELGSPEETRQNSFNNLYMTNYNKTLFFVTPTHPLPTHFFSRQCVVSLPISFTLNPFCA